MAKDGLRCSEYATVFKFLLSVDYCQAPHDERLPPLCLQVDKRAGYKQQDTFYKPVCTHAEIWYPYRPRRWPLCVDSKILKEPEKESDRSAVRE